MRKIMRFSVPGAVLGARGGGNWPIDPSDERGLRTKEPVFWVDVQLEHVASPRVGDRVHVLFEHEDETLVAQAGLALHGLLFRRLDL